MQLIIDLYSIPIVVISFQFSTFVSLMQLFKASPELAIVVISFQFSTFVSLMQRVWSVGAVSRVVISFQFSTFVSLMQLCPMMKLVIFSCD